MSLEYIRKTYCVPAEVGRGVICSGEAGVIVGHNGAHLEVLLDKDKPGNSGYYHPTWEVVYGEMRPVRKMTAGQRRYRHYLDSEYNGTFAEYLGVQAAAERRQRRNAKHKEKNDGNA